ncbi:hypothetical protein O4H66_07390 [Comamonadaceae bacterium G21597-S1]|nr:hypothetical protein [Comamonadaceae bacterium G21597-S1]
MKSTVFPGRSSAWAVAAAMLLLPAAVAQAQTIERVRMTDNDLSCQQIYNETVQMDAVVARASQPSAAPVAAATDANNANVGAQVAGAVAQTAIAHGAVRSGFAGFGGGSLLGGLLGGAAQQAATANAQQQAVAQQQAALQAQQGAVLAQQAQGRKEHLTTMFLSKGCKLGDMQK